MTDPETAETTVLRDEGAAVSAPGASPAKTWADRALRVLGLLLLVFTIAFGVIAYGQIGRMSGSEDVWAPDRFTLVIGTWFPSLWDVMIVPALLGFVALIGSAIIRPTQGTTRRKVVRGATSAVVVILAGLALILGGIASGIEAMSRAFTAEYLVLPETSPGGCRIVADERAVLKTSGGSIGIVQPGSIIVDWVRSYAADEIYRPFSGRGYTLTWNGPVAELHIPNTYRYTDDPIRCGH